MRLNEEARQASNDSPQNCPLDPPGVAPVGMAPEGASPTPGCLSLRRLQPTSLRVFGLEGEGEEALTIWCKTPSFRTSVFVVPEPCGPEMDL